MKLPKSQTWIPARSSGKNWANHCITLDAVHKDARDNTFVYLVKEKHSILGNELVCTMRYIDILAKDDAYAALNTGDSSLTESDLVILHSDRELSQGSKIRLLE